MKLHKLDVFNINSLYGKQSLDFDRDLAGANLFLIHGRTGSGKSTLMDAISLALFGKTPRLDDERGAVDADPASAMSRGTGECSAVLEFSRIGPQGGRIRYRASWAARRSRKRAEGNLQPVERSLERLESDGSWDLLTSGKKKTVIDATFTEALEGFGAEDFQRSMLLAQGRFDVLLSASERERALILERLTDTKQYKQLGEYAYQLAGAHNKNLDFLARQRAGTTPVSVEELSSAKAGAKRAAEAHQQVQSSFDNKRQQVEWWNERQRLHKQLEAIKQEQHLLDQDTQKHAPLLSRLKDHEAFALAYERIDEVERVKASLLACTNSLNDTLDTQKKIQPKAKSLALKNQELQTRLKSADALIDKLKEPCLSLKSLFSDGTSLKKTLDESKRLELLAKGHVEEKKKALVTFATALAIASKTLEEKESALAAQSDVLILRDAWQNKWREQWVHLRAQLQQNRKQEATLSRQNETFALALQSLKQDEKQHAERITARLLEPKAALSAAELHLNKLCLPEGPENKRRATRNAENEARELLALTQTAQQALSAHNDLQKELRSCQEELHTNSKKASAAQQKAITLRQSATHSSQRLTDAQTQLERLNLVSEIATRRAALARDEPCPLCGSERHPYIEEPHSCPDEILMIETQRAAVIERDVLQKRASTDEQKARQAENDVAALSSQQQSSEKATQALKVKRVERGADCAKTLQAAQLPKDCSAESCEAYRKERFDCLQKTKEALELLEVSIEKHNTAQQALDALEKEALDSQAALKNRSIALLEQEKNLKNETASLVVRRQDTRLQEAELQNHLHKWLTLPAGSPDGLAAPIDQWGAQIETSISALSRAEQEVVDGTIAKQKATSDQKGAREALQSAIEHAEFVQKQANEQQAHLEQLRSRARKQREIVAEIWQARDSNLCADLDVKLASDPNALLSRIEEERARLTESAQTAQEQANEAQITEKELEGAAKTLQQQQKDWQEKQSLFQEKLATLISHLAQGSEEEIRLARMTPDECAEAKQMSTTLQQRHDTQKTRRQERTSAIQSHEEKMPPAFVFPNKEENGNATEGYATLLNNDLDKLSTAALLAAEEEKRQQVALADVQRRAHQYTHTNALYQKAEESARVWQTLSKLIGTSSGAAFREFAQGLNLHRLIVKANHHLKRLSERYELTQAVREGIPTLEFAIVDRFQVGAPRSVRSLSGGERFLVSLALALGLSDLRSQSLPIETLLLDEGFGTLDPETLQVALSALERLQADGRQIGIISHVSGLKERIEAQVHIVEEGAGRSRIVSLPLPLERAH